MMGRRTAVHEQWLSALTSLPTAAGCEQRVVAWIEAWAGQRPELMLRRDPHGNLLLQRRRRSSAAAARRRPPIILEAHLDHPAFVVRRKVGPRAVEAEFRGGVADAFFMGTKVSLHHDQARPQTGRVASLTPGKAGGFKRVRVTFDRPVSASAGDVMTWALPPAAVRSGRLHAPACDDLAAVAAALATFDELLRQRPRPAADVRLLFTRAEEVGFLGAIAACKAGRIPRRARLICLENSRSFAESPIGGGPIVRVGDRTSTFDPDLTYRVAKLAEQLAGEDRSFRWQRKLMPGGTCEASAFGAYGYTATCLCLPLGNYHNMNDRTGRIARETISLADFHGLVRLLVHVARHLDDPRHAPALRSRLDDLFARRTAVLA